MSYRYNPLSGKIEFVGISTSDGTSLEATINKISEHKGSHTDESQLPGDV